jgi:hypothetical protein
MGNISAVAPQESLTVQKIYEWHKERGDKQESRGYLGASQLGKECERYLWYCFRVLGGKSSFEGRMYRLFETGNLAEKRFCDELRGIGCEVHETGDDGKQIAVHALGGHLSGHMDGVALGIPEAPKTWHVLEFKTHNAKSWEKLRSVGVKSSKPEHYAQMMVYMGLADLTRALYLAVNKDTDELHAERIEFNAKEFKVLLSKAERIIRANEPPPRISTRPDDFRCKFCDAYNMCWSHGEQAVMLPCKSCRSCCHITPEIDKDETWARWSCKKRGDITLLEQLAACDAHLLLPSFITFAEPVDAGDDWIEFKNKDGDTWRHGKGGDGSWTTEELIKTPAIMVGKRIIEQAKKEFGGTVKSAEDGRRPLVERYPPEFSALEWEGKPKDLAAGLEKRFPGLSKTEPTDRYADEAIEAIEYNGDVLTVVYKGDDYAAVWGLIPF